MKFPYLMLRDFVETSLNAQEVGDLLTMAGFELEGIEEVEGDNVLDIKVMANRGDGLSVLGLAREVLAKDAGSKPTELYRQASNRFPMRPPEKNGVGKKISDCAAVEIQTSNCTRYAALMFEGDFSASTPETIARRLRQSGMRPISLLVDLTNYVMLEVGQPLHAFDFETLRGGKIVVRQALDGEKLTTLDGVKHELNPGQMMICDQERPVSAAGIMGGEDTEVGDKTKVVLLESAHFVNTSVRKTRKEMGLNTEASYRFERSVDPEGVVAALNRLSKLLQEVDGGNSRIEGLVDVYPSPQEPKAIDLRMPRVESLLGMKVEASDARRYLEALGFAVLNDGTFAVTHPSWRTDIECEDDLIEEIGRVHGYEKIPELLPTGTSTQGGVFGLASLADKLRNALLRAELSQVVNYSFEPIEPLDDPWLAKVGPRNPVSPEMGLLRSSLYPGLAQSARRNGGKDLHLFEMGRVFGKSSDEIREQQAIAILSTGALNVAHWTNSESAQADFFSLKGTIEEIFASAQKLLRLSQDDTDPRLHPTRQAALVDEGGKTIGHFGQIHPTAAEKCGLPAETVLAHLYLEKLHAMPNADLQLRTISRNPSVRRDISILISKQVSFEQLAHAIENACGIELEKLWVFDVYEGKGVPEGSQSIAIALQLRKLGENFTDAEANQVRDLAVAALEPLGGKAR